MPSQPRWGQPSLQQPPAGLMWTLALGGIFLAAVEACVFCRFPDRELSGRLAQLCSQMEVQWKDCEVSWTFSAFALDDASLNKITEKTHRVLRVMEIKGSLYSLPSYWQWLRKTKLREYNREALCPPACRGSTILYNCSTCQGFEVYCWPRKRCFPEVTIFGKLGSCSSLCAELPCSWVFRASRWSTTTSKQKVDL